jgi:endonuclease/exonuclease/phosphatase family metal-dependent hydrolase
MAAHPLNDGMLRVATYNVRDCIGRDGAYAPHRIAAIIAGLSADVVAVQEITLDHAGDVVSLIEQTTGMHAIDGTLFERGVGRYGNLLLCRGAAEAQAVYDLSYGECEPRGLIQVGLASGGLNYAVFATHLGLGVRERRRQLDSIAQYVSASQGPAVMLGDFNVWLGRSEFRPLISIGFTTTSIRSYPTWLRPLLALDRVLVRPPARFVRSWREAGEQIVLASDHFPVVAEIEIS